LGRAYQKEWGKHLIRVEADDTSGDIVGEEWMNGIRDQWMICGLNGASDVGQGPAHRGKGRGKKI
jgi:hypothetical protein